MSNLLQVTRLGARGKVPVMLEMAVSPETAPYLVTSSRSIVWIDKPMDPTLEMWGSSPPEHIVRVAVRPDLKGRTGEFFRELIEAVIAMGEKTEWGNVHPFTEDGIHAAVEHVEFYELGELCLLIPRDESEYELPLKDIALDLKLLPQVCSWLPPDCAVVVPKDRSFVGLMGMLGRRGSVALVHNASRAIAVARRPAE